MALNQQRIFDSFSRQGIMQILGAELISAESGEVVMHSTLNEKLTQQDGFFHAGVLTTTADPACWYAAYTTMPDDAGVLTVESKVNFMKPVTLQKVFAAGKVILAGKTLVLTEKSITDEKQETVYITMFVTMMAIIKE